QFIDSGGSHPAFTYQSSWHGPLRNRGDEGSPQRQPNLYARPETWHLHAGLQPWSGREDAQAIIGCRIPTAEGREIPSSATRGRSQTEGRLPAVYFGKANAIECASTWQIHDADKGHGQYK